MIDLTKEEIELIKSMVAKESFALGQALTTVNSALGQALTTMNSAVVGSIPITGSKMK